MCVSCQPLTPCSASSSLQLQIFFQANIILTGNYTYFNYLTITLALSCLDDASALKVVRFFWPFGRWRKQKALPGVPQAAAAAAGEAGAAAGPAPAAVVADRRPVTHDTPASTVFENVALVWGPRPNQRRPPSALASSAAAAASALRVAAAFAERFVYPLVGPLALAAMVASLPVMFKGHGDTLELRFSIVRRAKT